MQICDLRTTNVMTALFFAFLTAPAAQTEPQQGIVGLLKLPHVFGELCKEPPKLEVPLYAEPRPGDVVGWIGADKHETADSDCYRVVLNFRRRSDGTVQELPVEEYEEEEPRAAIVVETRDRWAKLRLPDGAAWIEIRQNDDYLSLEELLQRRLAYLTEAWDRTLSATPSGQARRVPGDPRRHLIGYVEPILRGTEVRAFERPDRAAPVVGTCLTDECDRTLRSKGSPAQVAVFDRRPGWLQVALGELDWKDDRRVWIEDSSVWRFHAFASETARQDFENELFGRDDPTVRFIRSRTVDGRLWLYVEVLSHTIYDSDEPPRVVAEGWVPAHDAAGRSVVWFFSRD